MCKKIFLLLFICIPFVVSLHSDAQGKSRHYSKRRTKLDYPEVPRVSAYEAYLKFKAGKALIIQCGGERYESRHIIGSLHQSSEAVRQGKVKPLRLPRKGVEIFTYCY